MSYFTSRYSQFGSPNSAGYYSIKVEVIEYLVKSMTKEPVRNFLDIGCACGDLAKYVHEKTGWAVAGLDSDSSMIQKATELNIGDFKVGDILNPLDHLFNKFDVVASFEVFEHLTYDEHARAFKSFCKYSHKGSVGIIVVPNAGHPILGGWLAWSDYTHRSQFTPGSLAQFLRTMGVEKAVVQPWYIASSHILNRMRIFIGTLLENVSVGLTLLFSARPIEKDPFVERSFPFSSHIVGVFEIPRDAS